MQANLTTKPETRESNPTAELEPGLNADLSPTEERIEPSPSPSETGFPGIHTVASAMFLSFGGIALLYFARPVVLPIAFASIAGMTLKPLIQWLAKYHIPPGLGAAVVLSLSVATVGFGFVELGRPAVTWMQDAPGHMTKLWQRFDKMFPRAKKLSQAATALKTAGALSETNQVPVVQMKEDRGPGNIIGWTGINWSGSLLAGVIETLVLLYLLLASGDLFLQKLVHVMPTWRDKKRAVEINHEIQENISHYLFSVSLINLALGLLVAGGLYWIGVPNPALWGLLAALFNFIPYFGPIVGVLLVSIVGLLTFETLPQGLFPGAWYLVLHLSEANFITPILLGRRFTLNPVAIFVSLMFWTWLWGVPGAFLSVPILVSIKVVCDRVAMLAPLGELLSN
jgi:predicted PurR-regulated permease PerM